MWSWFDLQIWNQILQLDAMQRRIMSRRWETFRWWTGWGGGDVTDAGSLQKPRLSAACSRRDKTETWLIGVCHWNSAKSPLTERKRQGKKSLILLSGFMNGESVACVSLNKRKDVYSLHSFKAKRKDSDRFLTLQESVYLHKHLSQATVYFPVPTIQACCFLPLVLFHFQVKALDG